MNKKLFDTACLSPNLARGLAGFAILAALVWLLLSSAARAQQHAGQYELADIEYGAQIFAERCVLCHGPNGDLMPQANLRSGTFRNASSDRELSRVISDGVEGTAMVATGYTGAELTGLVAYLRNMSSYDPRGARIGDAAAGRELFYAAGECSTCHRVGGIGPKFPPDLTAIGALRSAATLERILLDPTGSLLPINRPVRAVTGDGRVINGRRLNEDTFRVQLIADDESLVSLDKAALREYTIGGESMMPDYGDRFSERQIADLVAFLLTLKGLN